MTPNLDPDPDNILGKGILDPEREAALLADGYIFAMFVQPSDARRPPFLLRCKRLIADAAADAFADAWRTRHLAALAAEPSLAPGGPTSKQFAGNLP